MRASGIQRVEAGNIRATLRHRIRIVLRPSVEKIVRRQHAPARRGIQAISAFVILQGLVVGRSRKRSIRVVGRWNVLQKVLRWRGPNPLRNDSPWKNRVKRSCGGNRVAELLR